MREVSDDAAWQVYPDERGNFDVGFPAGKGIVVICTVFGDREAADLIAAAPQMSRALSLIDDMEPTHTNPEARWMAGVARTAMPKGQRPSDNREER